MPVTIVPGGLDQPFDLPLRQMFPCPQVFVGGPFRGRCVNSRSALMVPTASEIFAMRRALAS
jgi:hypothetical protein